MKMIEFYEKYLIIKMPDGKTVKLRSLTDEERKIYDLSEKLNVHFKYLSIDKYLK